MINSTCFRRAVDRWPHVVAMVFVLIRFRWFAALVEHSGAPPSTEHTRTNTVTQTHGHTQTHTHTHITHSNVDGGASESASIWFAPWPGRVRRKKRGGNKLTDVAGEPADGTTPTTGPVGTTGRAEAESANGKEQIPLGADGMWRAASSRERVSRADS